MSIKYDDLLGEWADEMLKKIDQCNKQLVNIGDFSYKHGLINGYRDGLCMAMAILSRVENKHKRRQGK